MKRSALRSLAALALAATLVACGSSSNNGNNNGASNNSSTSGSATAARPAGTPGAPPTVQSVGVSAATPAVAAKVKTGGTLTIGTQRDATNFDSAKSQDVYSGYIEGLVVEPLFTTTTDFKVVPNLVDKVENPDDKTYVFHLHTGIKFQDGTDFDAEAVRWNLQRHIDDMSSVRHSDVTTIDSMQVMDPATLKIALKAPYAPFLARLTNNAGYMYSPTAFQKAGADKVANDLTGMGTGPFKFTEWQKGVQVTLDKNPNYWQKDATGIQLPYLDKVIFKGIPDETTRLTNLKTGDLDFIESPPPKDVKSIQQNSDLVYKQIPGIGFDFIMLETEKDPFNDKLVRQAFSYAIDRQQIVDTVNFGTKVAADTEIPGAIAGSVLGPYQKQDIAKAKALLQMAGKPKVSFTMQISNASAVLQQTAELLKDQISGAGFDLTIQPIEFATLVDNANKGSYQAGALGWSGGVDPDLFISNLFKSDAGFNLAHYKSPSMDDLIVKGQQTLKQEDRNTIYKQIIQQLVDDQPFIIYDWTALQQTSRKIVQNWQLGPSQWVQLYKVWKSQ